MCILSHWYLWSYFLDTYLVFISVHHCWTLLLIRRIYLLVMVGPSSTFTWIRIRMTNEKISFWKMWKRCYYENTMKQLQSFGHHQETKKEIKKNVLKKIAFIKQCFSDFKTFCSYVLSHECICFCTFFKYIEKRLQTKNCVEFVKTIELISFFNIIF